MPIDGPARLGLILMGCFHSNSAARLPIVLGLLFALPGGLEAQPPSEAPAAPDTDASPEAPASTAAPEVAAPPPTELVRPCRLGADDCFLDADGHTRRASVAYDAMRPELESHPWQALAWEASFLTAGIIWYWAEKQQNAVDWDYSTWKQRFSADAFSYDNNEFPMNFVFHPMAGSAFYGLARANELGILPSAAYAFATSFAWEYLIEFREKVSVNDVIMTAPSGIVLGEFFYKLGRYLNSAPGGGTKVHKVLAWTLGLPVAFHDWLHDRPRVPTDGARDELGFSADYWHRFRLSYGLVAANPTNGPWFGMQDLAVDAELVAMPGYLREGDFHRFFKDADRARFHLEGMFAGGGPAWEIEADLMLLGYYRQAIAASAHGLRGTATMVGLDFAYSYRNMDLTEYTDRWGSLHFPGLGLEQHVLLGPAILRFSLEANVDFSGVHAEGYANWQAQNPDVQGKDILEAYDYYYGWGASTRARFDLWTPWVDAGVRFKYGFANSREGMSRRQEEVVIDQHLVDTMCDVEGVLRVKPMRGLYFEASILRQHRHARIESLNDEYGLVRTMFSIGTYQ